jgi:hypothetical protein
MSNAQRIYAQTCRHLQAVQANIDRLTELNANEELALLTGRLQRLAFRAAPAPTERCALRDAIPASSKKEEGEIKC